MFIPIHILQILSADIVRLSHTGGSEKQNEVPRSNKTQNEALIRKVYLCLLPQLV